MNEELSNLIWNVIQLEAYQHEELIQTIELYWINRTHGGFINNDTCHLFSQYRNNVGANAEMLIEQAKHF